MNKCTNTSNFNSLRRHSNAELRMFVDAMFDHVRDVLEGLWILPKFVVAECEVIRKLWLEP